MNTVASVLVRTLRARRQNDAIPGSGDEGALLTALGHIRLALESWGARSAFIRECHAHIMYAAAVVDTRSM